MTEKPEVDDLLFRPNEYLISEYGAFGGEVIPQVRTHDSVVGLLAVLDQQGTGEIYDLEDKLRRELGLVRTRIEDDLQGAIEDEYE